MLTQKIFSVALAIIWSAVGVSCSYPKGTCTKPVVRREWRTFCAQEKAEWIRAVNVRLGYSPHIGCHTEELF